jgi:hypothetical protein
MTAILTDAPLLAPIEISSDCISFTDRTSLPLVAFNEFNVLHSTKINKV